MGRRPDRLPSTPAVRLLSDEGVEFGVHHYDYVDRGGTQASSAALGVDEHAVIKTLIFEDDSRNPFVVLMHGDREVSAKQLARVLRVRGTKPCEPAVAEKHSGYRVGGTSPFGTRKALPVYAEASIFELPKIYINGGSRGLLVSLDPKVLRELAKARPVRVAR